MEIIGGLIFLAIAGGVVGSIGAVFYAGVASWMTRGVAERGEVTANAVFLAYASAAWLCVIALIYVSYQDDFIHLPNGYSFRLDENSHNLLLNLKTQGGGRYGTAAASDTVGDVSQLQIAGRYMLGIGSEFGEGSQSRPNAPFLLDVPTGHVAIFPNYATMEAEAKKMGINAHLEPVEDIYHRYSKISLFWLLLALLPPGIAGLWGLRQLFYLREEVGLEYRGLEPRAD